MAGTYWHQDTSTYNVSVKVSKMIYFFIFRLILCSVWLGAIIVVGIAFFNLSNKDQKRTNLFRLQCVCILLTILYNASEVGNILYRLKTLTFRSNQVMRYTAYSHWTSLGHVAEHAIPLLADSALLFRISSFFPFPVYTKRVRLYVLMPFWSLLICRAILSIMVGGFMSVQLLTEITWRTSDPLPIHHSPDYALWGYCVVATMELSMASLYCILASSCLLFKAYRLAKSQFSVNNQKRVKARMQFFAEALMMCFVPPIFINLAAPIQLMGPFTTYAYFREGETILVNTSVICSILATSWSRIREDWSNNTSYNSNPDHLTLAHPDQLHGMTIDIEGDTKADTKEAWVCTLLLTIYDTVEMK